MCTSGLEAIFVGDVVYSIFNTVRSDELVETFHSQSWIVFVDLLYFTGFLYVDRVLSLIQVVVTFGVNVVLLTDEAEFVVVVASVACSAAAEAPGSGGSWSTGRARAIPNAKNSNCPTATSTASTAS